MSKDIETCIKSLYRSYEESLDVECYFSAARAKQQMIAFARMYADGELSHQPKLDPYFNHENLNQHYQDLFAVLEKLRASVRNLTDEDLPRSMLIYENLGLWECREKLNLSKEQMQAAATKLEARLESAREEPFRKLVVDTISNMRAFIR